MTIRTRSVLAIYALTCPLILTLTGCAFSTKMVDDKGVVVDCKMVGVGPISGIAAETYRDNCVRKYKALGYKEVP
ncbi:MAG: hypothetical protein NTX38_04515 [Methylobacter sp.]|nr:hypothetical protein [Methylobacter sp.]